MQQITNKTNKILYPDLSYQICGLCFNVHNELGSFRSEKSYADALEKILQQNSIKYIRENSLKPSFENEGGRRNIPDFIIEDKIILDVKAKRIITKEDYYQMKRYLISSNKRLGLIVNFRQKYLNPKRILN
ncbi:MAG: GxxExxY protein [Candidatus Terrybacteria bacterium]|nr:GxxExxY protein [Candidatus Terrybacteria bacterium]